MTYSLPPPASVFKCARMVFSIFSSFSSPSDFSNTPNAARFSSSFRFYHLSNNRISNDWQTRLIRILLSPQSQDNTGLRNRKKPSFRSSVTFALSSTRSQTRSLKFSRMATVSSYSWDQKKKKKKVKANPIQVFLLLELHDNLDAIFLFEQSTCYTHYPVRRRSEEMRRRNNHSQ